MQEENWGQMFIEKRAGVQCKKHENDLFTVKHKVETCICCILNQVVRYIFSSFSTNLL